MGAVGGCCDIVGFGEGDRHEEKWRRRKQHQLPVSQSVGWVRCTHPDWGQRVTTQKAAVQTWLGILPTPL